MNTWQIDSGKAHRGLIDNIHWVGTYHFLSENFIFSFGFLQFPFCFLRLEMVKFWASIHPSFFLTLQITCWVLTNSCSGYQPSEISKSWWNIPVFFPRYSGRMKHESLFTLRNSTTIDGLDIIMESTNWSFWLFCKKLEVLIMGHGMKLVLENPSIYLLQLINLLNNLTFILFSTEDNWQPWWSHKIWSPLSCCSWNPLGSCCYDSPCIWI